MQVRGSLMITAMKLISFSFDEENCSVTTKIAYIFNPATTLFGPFISFRTFQNIILSPVRIKKCQSQMLPFRITSFGHFLCLSYTAFSV
jgi:hypothetical protein